MTSLLFSFIKRAIIYPLIATVLVCLLISFAVSRQAQSAADSVPVKAAQVSMDDYSPKEYNEFSELKQGKYALTITHGETQSAVLYDNVEEQNDISNLFYLHPSSTEPWNNGCVKVMSDSWYQMNKSLDIKIGDTIEGDFYYSDDNESDTTVYKYKVKSIMNGKTAKSITKFDDADSLLLCTAYENIADKKQKTYYVVVAQRED